jgi:hypothetical protein
MICVKADICSCAGVSDIDNQSVGMPFAGQLRKTYVRLPQKPTDWFVSIKVIEQSLKFLCRRKKYSVHHWCFAKQASHPTIITVLKSY